MNKGLSLAQIALLVGYAGGMTGGQLLFKMAALRSAADAPPGERLFAMFGNGFFAAGWRQAMARRRSATCSSPRPA